MALTKSFIFCLMFLFVYQATATTNQEVPKKVRLGGQPISLYRQAAGYTIKEEDRCSSQCHKEYHKALKNITKFHQPPFTEDTFKKDNFEKYCKSFETMKTCLTSCNETQLTRLMLAPEKYVNYICSAFMEHVDCYKNAFDAVKDTCNTTEQCGNQTSRLPQTWKKYTASDVSDRSSKKAYFDSACDYYTCFFKCSRQSFVDKCTMKGLKVIQSAIKLQVNAVRTAGKIISEQYDPVDSNECNSLRSMVKDDDD